MAEDVLDGYRELTRRRSRLPATAAETDNTLWSLLFRNIGKDLSKISVSVSMNEPLNTLQVSAACFSCIVKTDFA